MAKIIIVASGKGSVGKTTTSASIATGLALRGHKTAVIDFDVGLHNLDLIMSCGCRVVYDLINAIQGEATLTQALIRDRNCEDLLILSVSQTRDKNALNRDGVEKIMTEPTEGMGPEYAICNSPVSVEQGALTVLYSADEATITINPEVSSVRGSDRILGILQSRSRKAEQSDMVKEHLLITRYSPEHIAKDEMLSVQDIYDTLRIPFISMIPESQNVLQASDVGESVVHQQDATVAEAYKDVIARLLGENREMRFLGAKKRGFFKRLFGGWFMSLIDTLFGRKTKTAAAARDRLQIIIAQERVQDTSTTPGYLPTLCKELLEVLSRYVNVSPDDIRTSQERQDGMDVLELNITLPEQKKV